MQIKDNVITLRDFIETDIEKRIFWEKIENEWQLWDGPWDYEGLTEEQKTHDLDNYIDRMEGWPEQFKHMPNDVRRRGFQICTNTGKYIGWINSYRIDDDFNIDNNGGGCAVGLTIPDTSERGKGCATHAMCLFIDYLFAQGEKTIYTQTWSGNVRMLGLANKLGFEEVMRKKDLRFVRGAKYDGLTFKLNIEKYEELKKQLH